MTTITDREAAALTPAERLSQRWDHTRPADTRPMVDGRFIERRAPTFIERLRNAWAAAARELAR